MKTSPVSQDAWFYFNRATELARSAAIYLERAEVTQAVLDLHHIDHLLAQFQLRCAREAENDERYEELGALLKPVLDEMYRLISRLTARDVVSRFYVSPTELTALFCDLTEVFE